MGNTMTDTITVEVSYALPHQQAIVPLEVAVGTTAAEAVDQSAIVERFEGLNVSGAKLGIFGKAVGAGQVLRAGDRVEIYRPLEADPKEVRKQRAARVRQERGE